jgi:hypothetical protein
MPAQRSGNCATQSLGTAARLQLVRQQVALANNCAFRGTTASQQRHKCPIRRWRARGMLRRKTTSQ